MLHHLQATVEPIAEPDVENGERCEDNAHDEVEGLERHALEVMEEVLQVVLVYKYRKNYVFDIG